MSRPVDCLANVNPRPRGGVCVGGLRPRQQRLEEDSHRIAPRFTAASVGQIGLYCKFPEILGCTKLFDLLAPLSSRGERERGAAANGEEAQRQKSQRLEDDSLLHFVFSNCLADQKHQRLAACREWAPPPSSRQKRCKIGFWLQSFRRTSLYGYTIRAVDSVTFCFLNTCRLPSFFSHWLDALLRFPCSGRGGVVALRVLVVSEFVCVWWGV